MYAPMLIPFTGLTAGIVAGSFGASYGTSISLLLVASLTYIYLIIRGKDPLKGFRSANLHYVWIFFAFAGIGVLDAALSAPYELKSDTNKYVAAEGLITDISQKTSGDVARLKVSSLYTSDGEKENADNLIVILRSDALAATVDDRIILPVRLQRIVDSPNYFESGYASYMSKKGILWQTRCEGNKVQIISHKSTFNGTATNLRDRLEGFIEKSGLSKETRYFLITILLGDKNYLDNETRTLFADAGISHILALSGMHIGIISVIVLWLLFPINLFGYYRQRMLITILILFIYAFLTGWQPSTVRATLMATAVLICVWLERKNSSWNSLLFATTLILLATPYAVFDIGLQMSFLCVASLIFFVRPLNPIEQHEHPRLYKLAAVILTSLAATLGTWALGAYYFRQIPLMFLVANLIVLPLLPAFMTMAIIYLTLHALGINAHWLASTIDTSYEGLLQFLNWLTVDHSAALIYSPSLITVIIWTALIGFVAVYVNSSKRKPILKTGIICLATFFCISVVITDNDRNKDGFIVQKGIGDISILSRSAGVDSRLKMQRYALSECTLSGKRIICLDMDCESIKGKNPKQCDLLIISGGCKENLSEIMNYFRTSQIAIHPNVRRKREDQLIMEADSIGIKCHSIRHDGPLRYISGKP